MKRDSAMGLFAAGVAIGAAGIAPGVSGGAIAVSLGLYQPAIAALAGFFAHARQSARLLGPLAAGVGAGLALAGYVLLAFYDMFAAEALYLFAGLVLGSLPSLMRAGGPWRTRRLIPIALGAAAYLAPSALLPAAAEAVRLTGPAALGCGAVLAVGTVIPGVSSSFLLMRLGLYRAYLDALAAARLPELALMGLGFALAAALLVRAVDRVFRRHAACAYMLIAGFTLMSVVEAIPPLSAAMSPVACVLLLPLGAGAGLLLRGSEAQ